MVRGRWWKDPTRKQTTLIQPVRRTFPVAVVQHQAVSRGSFRTHSAASSTGHSTVSQVYEGGSYSGTQKKNFFSGVYISSKYDFFAQHPFFQNDNFSTTRAKIPPFSRFSTSSFYIRVLTFNTFDIQFSPKIEMLKIMILGLGLGSRDTYTSQVSHPSSSSAPSTQQARNHSLLYGFTFFSAFSLVLLNMKLIIIEFNIFFIFIF